MVKDDFSWEPVEPQGLAISREVDEMGKKLSVLWGCAIRLPGSKFEFQCRHGLTIMQFAVKNCMDINLIAMHEKFVKLREDGKSLIDAQEGAQEELFRIVK